MTDLEVGWAAGILDGEGSVLDGEGSVLLDKRTAWRRPKLAVTSTDIEIVQGLHQLFGGAVISVKYKLSRRPCWTWRLSGAEAVLDVLRQLAPHLRCPKKRARAELLLRHFPAIYSRNGFYTETQKLEKHDFETRFFAVQG